MDKFNAIDELFCRLCDVPDTELPDKERAFVRIWHSTGIIQNGGFHNFLCEVGPEAELDVAAFDRLGLTLPATLIQCAIDLWKRYRERKESGFGEPDEFRDRFSEELDAIEKKFYSYTDSAEFHDFLCGVLCLGENGEC